MPDRSGSASPCAEWARAGAAWCFRLRWGRNGCGADWVGCERRKTPFPGALRRFCARQLALLALSPWRLVQSGVQEHARYDPLSSLPKPVTSVIVP